MLKKSIQITEHFQIAFLLCLTVVFPILIAVLANTWTNQGPQSSLAGWFLLFVGFLQLLLGAYVIVSKTVCPEAAMAELLETEEHLENKTSELQRREEAYRLIRATFNQLTSQSCKIGVAEPDFWCKSGFEEGLKPIMETLLRNMHTVVGVRSSVYTLEVYLAQMIQIEVEHIVTEEDGLKLAFFFGASVERASVLSFLYSRTSPALSAHQTNTAFSQHISSNQHLFYDGDKLKAGVYFRTFAVAPLYPACSSTSPPIGVLMLTSMQDQPFSPDVLDTMAFFGSITSTFLYSYEQCLFRHLQTLGQHAV